MNHIPDTHPTRHRCPACGTWCSAAGVCPRCESDEPTSEWVWRQRPADWVPVHACPDEWIALALEAELGGHGIACWRRCIGVPGYLGLLGIQSAHWGWLLVDREDVVRAREIVRLLLRSALADGGPCGSSDARA